MRITGQQIIERVAADHQLTVSAFTGEGKTNKVALPRQTAMYLARTLCPHLSYFAIGQMLGGRDHSTVFHGVQATIKRMASDPIPGVEMNETRVL